MPRREAHPQLHLIAGPNGAGKTTFAREFLPHFVQCREFVNADLLAAGLSPFAPERAALAAGRLMLERIHELAKRRVDFGFETTLAGRGHARVLRAMKSSGYGINIYFLWLPTAEFAMARVADRVRHGGHDVPPPVIRRRFVAGLRNFFGIYSPLAERWIVFDGSQPIPQKVVSSEHGKCVVANGPLHRHLLSQAGV